MYFIKPETPPSKPQDLPSKFAEAISELMAQDDAEAPLIPQFMIMRLDHEGAKVAACHHIGNLGWEEFGQKTIDGVEYIILHKNHEPA